MGVAALGAITSLDMVSWGQFMISRPIVAAPLAGFVLGDPAGGMWAGVLLEILSLHQLPVGASRQWDTGPAAVVAALVTAKLPGNEPLTLLLAAGFGVVVAWLGSWSVQGMRHLNGRFVVGGPQTEITPEWLTRRHLVAMGIDFLRAGLLTLLTAGAVVWVLAVTPVSAAVGLGLTLGLVALIGLAVGADLAMVARGRTTWLAFAFGMLLSTVVWVWLR